MQIVSREESGSVAPFDLAKTPRFDRKTDKVVLAVRTFDLANNYLGAAKYLFDVRPQYIPVVLSNVSFSCELYLKALLLGYNTDFGNIHGLQTLFEKLPNNIKDYVSQNIAIADRDNEFSLYLAEQDKAFETYRYMNEAESITANPIFLFAFAHILKYIYEALIEDYSELSEKEVGV